MQKARKSLCNYLFVQLIIEHLLILASKITGYVSISAFASLVGIHIIITSYTRGLKIWATTAGITKYKSIIKKT